MNETTGQDRTGAPARAAIPVTVGVPAAAPSASRGNALAILSEVAARLDALLEDGTPATIDLRRPPLDADAYGLLAQTLGDGEIDARIEALGASRVRETGIHGVWWVTHYNLAGQILGELLEVSLVPEILASDRDEARHGLARLRERLARAART